jgi:hypothetical protein
LCCDYDLSPEKLHAHGNARHSADEISLLPMMLIMIYGILQKLNPADIVSKLSTNCSQGRLNAFSGFRVGQAAISNG